jgi:hypothetical protein
VLNILEIHGCGRDECGGVAVTSFAEKVVRHYRWGRQQGFGRLVEEDQLNPLDRSRTALRKYAWRRAHGVEPGTATPVFVLGAQRSGTNMLVRGLEQAPEVAVHNENDRRAFERFRLREDDVVRGLVTSSRHRFVLFKPLCDSHRALDLLELCGPGGGRVIWTYRRVDDRVRSSLAKFGGSNQAALAEIAAGRGLGTWQAGGLTPADLDLLRSLDVPALDAASGSALFWYLRNKLFFELSLDRHENVALASYDEFLKNPERTMRAVCTRLGLDFRAEFIAGIEPGRSPDRPPLDLHPEVRRLCDELSERLDGALAAMYPASSR